MAAGDRKTKAGTEMPGVARFGAAVASTLVLLAPAIWNRFPLLQYDTGGYLARWFEGYLVPSRSTVYGLFLNLLATPDFWPAVALQSALTVWVLALVLRALGFGGRPFVLFGVTAALAALTTLPWLSSILLTDIFAGLAVLAAHLLIFAHASLSRFERNGLVALIAFAVATHSATFAVMVALVAAAALARWLFRTGSAAGMARSAAAIALGAALLVGANYIVAGKLAWTPGGLALSFGRMLQDGIVARYLADHCPDPRMKLCAHRNELPSDADVFFWSGEGSIFNNLGRFKGLGDEMSAIVTGSLRDYPLWQAEMAVAATAHQLTRIDSGEGVVDSAWHTYWAIEKFAPSAAPAMHAARQQHGEIGFAAINRIHRPVALASMLLLLLIAALGLRREAFADLGALATTAALALIANALVCGVLSNPHDRYGARLVWIAPLVVTLLLCRLYARRGLSQAGGRTAAGPLTAEPIPPA
jgi:hypothetical protein